MNRYDFSKPVEILMVEDNIGDVRLMKEAFRRTKLMPNLHAVSDGIQAISFLKKRDEYVDKPTPGLIILDLNMPKKDGREVLQEIKADVAFKHIPVVILTTSKDRKDIQQSYDLRANCYITKPVELDQFLRVVESIEKFWLTIVELPKN